jgi:hypothetical protein
MQLVMRTPVHAKNVTDGCRYPYHVCPEMLENVSGPSTRCVSECARIKDGKSFAQSAVSSLLSAKGVD